MTYDWEERIRRRKQFIARQAQLRRINAYMGQLVTVLDHITEEIKTV